MCFVLLLPHRYFFLLYKNSKHIKLLSSVRGLCRLYIERNYFMSTKHGFLFLFYTLTVFIHLYFWLTFMAVTYILLSKSISLIPFYYSMLLSVCQYKLHILFYFYLFFLCLFGLKSKSLSFLAFVLSAFTFSFAL